MCTAYSIELGLEFSSNAQSNNFPVSGFLDLYQPTHRTCTALELGHNNTIVVIDMAHSCVVVDDESYTFYNVSWLQQNSSAPVPACTHTRSNILHKGDRIYKSTDYETGSREEESITSFRQTLSANSWLSSGEQERRTNLLQLSNADVKDTLSYTEGGSSYTRAVLLSQVGGTNIHCVSTAFGRHGDGFMSLRVYGCFGDIPDGRNCYQVIGTALAEADAQFIRSKPWNTSSNLFYGLGIYNFTKGVVNKDNKEGVPALTMLLSGELSTDDEAVNKYAVVYKHYSDYRVPQYTDLSRKQKLRNASSGQRITVFVKEWALIVFVVWPILLASVSAGFHFWGKRKKLPMNVIGEGAIAQRWLSRFNDKMHAPKKQLIAEKQGFFSSVRGKWSRLFAQPHYVFLNVETGELDDDIVVGSNALYTDRDRSRIFRKVD